MSPPPPPTTIEQKKKKETSVNNEVSATACSNCGTTTTPLWRRAPNGDTICNACGLYLKARNVLRPPSMKRNNKNKKDKDQPLVEHACTTMSAADAPNGTCPGGGQCNGTGGSPSCEGCPAFNQHQVNKHALICANCRTTTTPLWRRDEAGNTICNACGLYYKLHAVHRPVSMKRSVIKRRKRIIVSDTGEIKEEEEEDDELDSSSSSSNNEEEDDDDDDEEKVAEKQKKKRRVVNKRKPTTKLMNSVVPAIEDYIIPKRTSFASQQQQREREEIVVNTQRIPPPPTTPPFHATRTLPTLPTTTTTTTTTVDHSIRQRFDPLFDYRSTNKNTELPPIIQQSNNPYDALIDFDEAMTKLERLRRRVLPEQSKVLSRLTHSLEDIVTRAEHILLPPPQQQQQQRYTPLQQQQQGNRHYL